MSLLKSPQPRRASSSSLQDSQRPTWNRGIKARPVSQLDEHFDELNEHLDRMLREFGTDDDVFEMDFNSGALKSSTLDTRRRIHSDNTYASGTFQPYKHSNIKSSKSDASTRPRIKLGTLSRFESKAKKNRVTTVDTSPKKMESSTNKADPLMSKIDSSISKMDSLKKKIESPEHKKGLAKSTVQPLMSQMDKTISKLKTSSKTGSSVNKLESPTITFKSPVNIMNKSMIEFDQSASSLESLKSLTMGSPKKKNLSTTKMNQSVSNFDLHLSDMDTRKSMTMSRIGSLSRDSEFWIGRNVHPSDIWSQESDWESIIKSKVSKHFSHSLSLSLSVKSPGTCIQCTS